ncbi:RRM1_TatSF1_like and RRM2_TatSF1_like domain-containing protein barc [Lycorma delicatula]|uniref:RRM1_TatSF1_like and RRM2_TatSF1_like domain-containing protein barc n=1 Tax=Lycorma delicatula TaxID=130591 RepID=UPI003F51AA49
MTSNETEVVEKHDDIRSSPNTGTFDESNVTYEGDKCIYVDPQTKYRYVWDENKKEWVSEQQSLPGPANDYNFDGTTYTYTDKNTNKEYKWNTDKNSWLPVEPSTGGSSENESSSVKSGNGDDDDNNRKQNEVSSNITGAPNFGKGVYGYENDTHTYTDPTDNTVYVWDRDKNAWFPKVDEDFLAQYQMNYGFVDPNKDSSPDGKKSEKTTPDEAEDKDMKDIRPEKRKAQQQPPTWFEIDDQNNTKVYVSNLPLDITEKEFVDLMQKCGLVMKDLDKNKMKVKLYSEPGTNQLKGDGLCTYIKKESVELALNLIDGCDYRGHKLHVERARFTMKGNTYDPSLKPKKKKKKDLEKMKKIQEKLFDWRPDKLRGERSRNESVVIVKNLFDPVIFERDVKLILEFQQELRDECIKCGAVKRVIIYDRHPQGVAQVNFKEPEAADACIQLLNGRWFNKRRITAETWDGKTKYKIIETEEEIKKRIEKWDQFLHTEESDGNLKSDNFNEKEKRSEKEESEKEQTEVDIERDSDQETRSSFESDYTTDEEK